LPELWQRTGYSFFMDTVYCRTRFKFSYPCGPVKHTLKTNTVLKHDRITTAREEAFRATAVRPKFGSFSRRKLSVWKVKPRSSISL